MIAPEPILRAYLHVVYQVSIYLRARSRGENCINDRQLFDLMDAIHNIPEMLTRYGEFFTSERIRNNFFVPYDERWAKDADMSLCQVLDDALARDQQS